MLAKDEGSLDEKCVWIHIGMHKTASTFLQSFFNTNQAVLNSQGFYYPTPNPNTKAHHPLARACYENATHVERKAFWAETLDEIAQCGYSNILMSSEQFEWLKHPQALRELFPENYRFKIVAYVRRQDDQIESRYQQRLKDNPTLSKTFAQFVEELDPGFLDLNAFLGNWASVFGVDAMVVRQFEIGRFPGGRIERDFLKVLGLPDDLQTAPPDTAALIRSKGSIRKDMAEVLRFTNSLGLKPERRKKVLQRINFLSEKLQREEKEAKTRYMTTQQRIEFLRGFEKSNRAVARTYFGEEQLFTDPEALPVWDSQSINVRQFIAQNMKKLDAFLSKND